MLGIDLGFTLVAACFVDRDAGLSLDFLLEAGTEVLFAGLLGGAGTSNSDSCLLGGVVMMFVVG
jgi:hypothetical protein